ncbi:MAG: carboxylesterase [Marmoricola sp.]|nr:carboxylesterase [Marmoricola sp.]
MQKTAPLTVNYGRALELAGQHLPPPVSLRVPTRHGPVRIRIQRPTGSSTPPVYVHLHGGAFIMRHPRMDDFFARFLVSEAAVAVVSVDYDVAPQVRYPVAQEEVYDVAAFLAERGRELDLDGSRLALGVAEAYADKQPTGSPMLTPAILDLVRATYFRDVARRHGVVVRHRVVPRADHYFLTPENATAEMGLIARVLRSHLT